MSDIISEEERERMAKAVWETTKEEIEKNVTYAISSELRMDMSSRTKRLVAAEMDNLLRPMIEARMEELRRVAEKTMDRLFQQMEDRVLSALESKLTYHTDNIFDSYARELAGAMKSAAFEVVKTRVEAVRREKEQEYFERMLVAAEKSSEPK